MTERKWSSNTFPGITYIWASKETYHIFEHQEKLITYIRIKFTRCDRKMTNSLLVQVQWLFIVLIINWHHEDAAKWSVDLGQVLWLLVSQFVACHWQSVSGYTVSPGLKLLAVSTQDGEPQYAALVQPPTCRLHEGTALLTDVAYCFFFCDFLYCFYSSLQFNSWNHSISSVQSTVSLIRWLSAYASVIVTQACHGQG